MLTLRPELEVVYTGGYEGASPIWQNFFLDAQERYGDRIRKVGQFQATRWRLSTHNDTNPLFDNLIIVPYDISY